jgi:hypothetical protein
MWMTYLNFQFTVKDVTPLKKWATPEEAAQWCYFMTVTNTFCTGQFPLELFYLLNI